MPTKRPWWQWLLAGLVALWILGALFGGDDEQSAAGESAAAQPAIAPAGAGSTVQTAFADARRAVDDEDYAAAVEIAAALPGAEESAIGRRIADRLAGRAIAALLVGDPGRARDLIIEAQDYPSTAQVRLAQASYKAAKQQAAERGRAAAQRRREAARQRREETAQAAPESQGHCDPNYSGCVPAHPPDVNCPQVDGPVDVVGSDPHGLDRDADGVACE